MNVELRDVRSADLPIFFRHQADPVAHRMAGFEPRDEPAFMAHWQQKILGDDAARKATILADGEVAGLVVCFDRNGKREIGYWIGREHWGRGIASQALASFLPLETERPLHAIVAKHNAASLRILHKCGFEIESEGRGCPDGRGPEVDEYTLVLV